MYSLVVLLSILASASFVLAFVRGRPRGTSRCSACGWRCCSTRTRGACSWPRRWRSRGWCCGGAGRSQGARRRAARRALGAAVRAVAADERLPGRAHGGAVGRAAVAAAAAGRPGRAVRPRRGAAAGARRVLRAAPPAAGRSRGARAGGDRRRRRRRSPGCARRSSRRGRRATSPSCSARCCWRWRRSSRAARAGRRWRWSASRSVWLMSGPPPTKSNVRTVVGRRRAVDPPGRPRRLDPARAGARALPLPAARRRLPDADGARAPTRARPTGATASRACAPARPSASCCRAIERLDRGRRVLIVTPRGRRAALAGALEPRRPHPHARVARGAAAARAAAADRRASRRCRGARTPSRGALRGALSRIRTCRWSSWWISGTTTFFGPLRFRRGPTKTFTAPAATKRSTRSCASSRSTCDGLIGRCSVPSLRG